MNKAYLAAAFLNMLLTFGCCIFYSLRLHCQQSDYAEKTMRVNTRQAYPVNAFMLFAALLCSSNLFATEKPTPEANSNFEVATEQQGSTQEELAAIYALKQTCPKLIGASKGFEQGYARLVQAYMPQVKNPVEALNARAQSPDFKKYLTQAHDIIKRDSSANNKQVCKDVIAYQ